MKPAFETTIRACAQCGVLYDTDDPKNEAIQYTIFCCPQCEKEWADFWQDFEE